MISRHPLGRVAAAEEAARAITGRKKTLWKAAALVWLAGITATAQAAGQAASAGARQAQEFQIARRGLDRLMNGDPDAAIEVFQSVQENDPESPLGDLLVADALWWKIYFASGNLIDPDVFDVVTTETTPYDGRFNELVNRVIHKAQARIAAGQDVPRNELYLGMAYGLQARLLGMRGQDLPTARAGKKMRSTLLEALKDDPQLNDAYLGVGIYNYFVDTLPAIVKIIRWFIGLPGGDRQLGLDQIERAATQGDLARGEAKFYLAKDFSRPYEGQYQKSLQLFQQLTREYPENGLWKILVGTLEVRRGHVAEGEALYRQVLKETAGATSEAGRAFHRAAQQALLEQHSKEKLGD
jgi:tetratricopeptide (TPR) repeat protein